MRIGLILYGRLDLPTGGFLYDRYLVEALRGRGHRVEILGLPWRSYAAGLIDNLSLRIDRQIRRPGWDLILQDGLCHPSLLRVNRRLRRARAGPPRVAVIHQVLCRQPRAALPNLFLALIEGAFLRTLDAALVNSPDTLEKVRKLSGRPMPACLATPGGDRLGSIDAEDAIHARSRKRDRLELLFVGGPSPIKGLAPLLESLAGLTDVPWRLTVAGDAPGEGPMARRAHGPAWPRDLGGEVVFRGHLEETGLRQAFVRSQVFVMPFAQEGFGIAALEAMAFGLPVIGSTRGGVRAFVQDGVNGFLVAPGDLPAVRRRLRQLHIDRERLARMGAAARAAALEQPGWAPSMERACRFLESVNRERRR
jgi:glycosyltransferase involved in cell wall biosynthesis